MSLSVAQIDVAIAVITDGTQEYTIGDREYRYGDLEALRQLRKDAVAVEAATAKTIFQRVRFGSIT